MPTEELRIDVDGAKQVTPEKAPVYDPDQSRDTARARITYWLLALLTFLVICTFAAMYLVLDTKPTFEQLKVMIELLLGPLVALVSAATGFYFGAGSIRNNGSSRTDAQDRSGQ